MKNIIKFLIIILVVFSSSIMVSSAEILQINTSKSILVGDQNRTLSIELFCIDINDNDEKEAINILKKEFPRGSKVKIKPVGFKENTLVAKIYNSNETKEMSKLLIAKNLSKGNCGE